MRHSRRYSTAEVAAMIGKSPRTIRQFAEYHGDIGEKIGRNWTFSAQDVARLRTWSKATPRPRKRRRRASAPAAVLAAALPVLEAVESLIESIERPGQVMDWDVYFALRRNFYAFRASMEAGGPAGWRVGDEQEGA